MVRRHYGPVRFICVTNDTGGLNSAVEVVADREDFAAIPSPHGGTNPTCYRRLRLFAPDAAETFGDRIVAIDLDCVFTGNLRPLWDRPEYFVGWRDPFHPRQLNGSMFLLQAGSHPNVWAHFDPQHSPRAAKLAGYKGSDQAWISFCLPGAPAWTALNGVYSYRTDMLQYGLPPDAAVTVWHGAIKPWDPQAQALPWVREHWR